MKKHLAGKVVEWDEKQGFGFLKSGSARVFLHRREFSGCRKKIEVGDRVTFLMGTDAKGRPCASEVGHVGNGGRLTLWHCAFVAALLVLPGIALARSPVPMLYAGGYLAAINLLAVGFYWSDKKSARLGRWRIPEARLHFLELLGGWPLAFLAQRALRHKTSKISFQIVFWLIVGLYQAAAWDIICEGKWTRKGFDEISRLAGSASKWFSE